MDVCVCVCVCVWCVCVCVLFTSVLTWDAGVGSLQVGHQVLSAGLELDKVGVQDGYLAGAFSGAFGISERQDISVAADVVAGGEAASDAHSTVVGLLHHDHVSVGARGVEVLQMANFLHICELY